MDGEEKKVGMRRVRRQVGGRGVRVGSKMRERGSGEMRNRGKLEALGKGERGRAVKAMKHVECRAGEWSCGEGEGGGRE